MGRKPSASKIMAKVPMPESFSLDKVEPYPSNGNITLPGTVHAQLENPNPISYPSQIPNSSVDGVVTHNERNPLQENVNQEYGLQKKSPYQRKKSKSLGSSVRRSERVKSGVVHTYVSRRGGGVEYIDAGSDSEKDEPAAQMEVEQVLSEQEPEKEPEPEPTENLGDKRSGENFGHAFQRIEALEKITEELKSKVDELTGLHEAPSMAPISYESLYIDSLKKNESLTTKLENALAKIEMYEKERHVLLEVLDKMKDSVNAVMVSNLAKATEAAVNASSQAMRKACTASKRKRNGQDS